MSGLSRVGMLRAAVVLAMFGSAVVFPSPVGADDVTTDDVSLVKDINPGGAHSGPTSFAVLGGGSCSQPAMRSTVASCGSRTERPKARRWSEISTLVPDRAPQANSCCSATG